MNFSQFEQQVLIALIQGDREEAVLQAQLADATVTKRDCTGVGLFTAIQVPRTCPQLSTTNRYIEETPKTHLEHPKLNVGAGAMLWFEDGYIAMLECYTYGADQWPVDESQFIIINTAEE